MKRFISHPNRQFPRRQFLRGMGVSLALPWLESTRMRSEETGKRSMESVTSKPPTRFACIYFSNGVEPEHWWAKPSGKSMEIGPGLAPMQPYRDDFNFLKGLYNQKAVDHPSAHLGRIPNLLSGAWVSNKQSVIRVGQTMDQVMAKSMGRVTQLPSLSLGIEPTEMRLEDGLSMLYGSCISWATDTKPAMKEIYPARVFDMLVGDGSRRPLDRSVLDEVRKDARSVRNRLSHGDQTKLDEYLDSIRSIEQRIERAASEETIEGWQPTLKEPNMPRPKDGLPQDVPRHMQLMMDLLVMAFQMDKTRIATCMLNNDLSQMNFGFLKGVQGSLHLDLTHNGKDPTLEAMYLKTNQFHIAQFAYLLKRMKSIQEGEGTLLDHSILLCCSNLFDGDRHQATEMPMLLAGKGGESFMTGRILNFIEQPKEERRACNLYLSIMKKMGVSMPAFGDSDRTLKWL
ncbi:MAG: DUF1552 domain-containing protein [Verrucomicrobia bacterium]|nr:DUF1552 domain-containing protein [Verrucomicrobiota bacterium]